MAYYIYNYNWYKVIINYKVMLKYKMIDILKISAADRLGWKIQISL